MQPTVTFHCINHDIECTEDEFLRHLESCTLYDDFRRGRGLENLSTGQYRAAFEVTDGAGYRRVRVIHTHVKTIKKPPRKKPKKSRRTQPARFTATININREVYRHDCILCWAVRRMPAVCKSLCQYCRKLRRRWRELTTWM